MFRQFARRSLNCVAHILLQAQYIQLTICLFRLDLDACKSRVRKSRSMLGQQMVNNVILWMKCLLYYS